MCFGFAQPDKIEKVKIYVPSVIALSEACITNLA